MRFSPSTRLIAYTLGYAEPAATRRLRVILVDRLTGAFVEVAGGLDPRWESEALVIARSHDGTTRTVPVTLNGEALTVQLLPANVGDLDARADRRAWAPNRQDGVLVHEAAATSPLGAGTYEPSLSPVHPWLTARWLTDGHLGLYEGLGDEAPWSYGPGTAARWAASGAFVFTWAGHVYGAHPTQPHLDAELTPVGWEGQSSAPVPVALPGGGHAVGMVLALSGNDGLLVVFPSWSALAARQNPPMGFPLVVSAGSAFDWDLALDPADPQRLLVAYFTPQGTLAELSVRLDGATIPIDPTPPVRPDQPFVVDPLGVIEDVAAWLFSPNQGPDVHIALYWDGLVRFFCKSDELSGDGPNPAIGEHWDVDADYIGHLDDASTGRRILDGKEVIAEDIVRMFPDTHAAVWASLPLNHNWFRDGARLWTLRRAVSGTSIRYVTDIMWTVPPRETPHTNVWKNIPIEIRIDVGYGVIHGKEVRLRSAYIPDGNAEVSYYGEPNGFNAWIAGPFATFEPEWMR